MAAASVGTFHLSTARLPSASMRGSGTESDFEDEGTSILQRNRRRLNPPSGNPPRKPHYGKVASQDMDKKMPAHCPPPHAFPRRLSSGPYCRSSSKILSPGVLLGDAMDLPPPATGEGSSNPTSLTRDSTFNSCARPENSSLTRDSTFSSVARPDQGSLISDSTFGSIPRPGQGSLISESTFGSNATPDHGSLTRESTFNSNDTGDQKMPAFPNEAVAQMEAVIRRQFRRNSADPSDLVHDQNFQEEAPSLGNRLRAGSSASHKSVERFVRPNNGDQEIRDSSIHRTNDRGGDPSMEAEGLRSYISSSLRPLANAVRRFSGDSLSSGAKAKIFPGSQYARTDRKDEIHRLNRPTDSRVSMADLDDQDAREMDLCARQMTQEYFDHDVAPTTQEPSREDSLVIPTDARDFRSFQRQQEEAFAELERQKNRRAHQETAQRAPQGGYREASSSSSNERSPVALACRVFPIREADTASETDVSDAPYSGSYSPPSQIVTSSGFVVAERIDPNRENYYSEAKVVAASEEKKCRPLRSVWVVTAALLLIVVGAVLGAMLPKSETRVVSEPFGGNGYNATAFRYPRTRAPHPNPKEEAMREIVNTVSDPKTIDERSSPQHLAFKWLSERDHYFHNVGSYDDDWTTLPAWKVTQRYVLAVLYYSTGGRHYWNKDLSFLTEKDECEWTEVMEEESSREQPDGVLCDDSNRILGIELEANLTGTIPSEIGALRSTMVLELAENHLHGAIPESLGDLDQLVYLSLGGNNLRGTVPDTLGNLIHLEHLVLSGNRLSGAVPNALSRLTKLGQLRLESNELYGDLGPVFCVSQDPPKEFWSDCYSEKPDFSDAEIKCACCSACCDSSSDACFATRGGD